VPRLPPVPLSPQRAPLLLHLVPLLCGAVAFAAGLGGDFVLDDVLAIARNPVVNGEVPWWEAFARTFWGDPLDSPAPSYRPVAVLSFALDGALFGRSALGFHLSSLALYLVAIHAGQRLAERWLSPLEACLGACLFAVLPVHAENVSSLVGRADTLALLFGVTALRAIEPTWRGARLGAGRWAGGVLSLLLALGSKESAVVLPALALVFALRPGGGGAGRTRFAPAVIFFAFASAYLATRALVFPRGLGGYEVPDDVLAGAAPHQRLWHSLELLARYAALVLLPVDLCTGRKYAEVAAPGGLPGALALAGLALLALAAWRTARDLRGRRPPFVLAGLVAFAPFSSLVVSVPEAMADRFLLSPTYFFALAAAPALGRLFARPAGRALVVFVVACFAAASAFYATRWSTDLVLLRHAVTACPSGVHNHQRLAEELARSGAYAESAWHFAVASEGRRHFPLPWRHPAAGAELELSPEARLGRVHELLRIDLPRDRWLARFAGYLERRDPRLRAALEAALGAK
jgi:hypothetical protein